MLRCKETGHIIEIQLHLREYLDLKESGGHEHCTFARTFKVRGVTKAVQLIQYDDEDEDEDPQLICDVGERQIEQTEDRLKKARMLRQLGDLHCAMWEHGKKGVVRYDSALRIVEENIDDATANRPSIILKCEILSQLASCVYEMHRLKFLDDMKSEEKKWMKVDARPWIECAQELATKRLEPRHPLAMRIRRIKADILVEDKQKDKAEALYKSVLNDQKDVLGRDHPETVERMVNLANMLVVTNIKFFLNAQDKEKIAKGYTLYLDGLESALKNLGPKNEYTRDIADNLALVAYDNDELLFQENPNLKERLDAILSGPEYEDLRDLMKDDPDPPILSSIKESARRGVRGIKESARQGVRGVSSILSHFTS